jgi:hypothetical protein
MRQKNTPTITKGIVTNHMTTKDTIMKAIIMQKRHTIMMPTKVTTIPRKFTSMKPTLKKVIITMPTKVTTTDMLMV